MKKFKQEKSKCRKAEQMIIEFSETSLFVETQAILESCQKLAMNGCWKCFRTGHYQQDCAETLDVTLQKTCHQEEKGWSKALSQFPYNQQKLKRYKSIRKSLIKILKWMFRRGLFLKRLTKKKDYQQVTLAAIRYSPDEVILGIETVIDKQLPHNKRQELEDWVEKFVFSWNLAETNYLKPQRGQFQKSDKESLLQSKIYEQRCEPSGLNNQIFMDGGGTQIGIDMFCFEMNRVVETFSGSGDVYNLEEEEEEYQSRLFGTLSMLLNWELWKVYTENFGNQSQHEISYDDYNQSKVSEENRVQRLLGKERNQSNFKVRNFGEKKNKKEEKVRILKNQEVQTQEFQEIQEYQESQESQEPQLDVEKMENITQNNVLKPKTGI